MKYYREQWKPEKPVVDKSDQTRKGLLTIGDMTRLPSAEGTDTYVVSVK